MKTEKTKKQKRVKKKAGMSSEHRDFLRKIGYPKSQLEMADKLRIK